MDPLVSHDVPGWPACRLAELVSHAVRAGIAAYRRRGLGGPAAAWPDLPALDVALAAGAVRFGPRDLPPPEIDEAAAVRAALEAVRDGLVFVFVDGVRRRDPDEVLALTPESRVRYVKLAALRGI